MSVKQYTIGEFAIINKTTPRILRNYDKLGLLKPAFTSENGYRIYTSYQIKIVTLIQLYRSCGFSLLEIKELIPASDLTIQQAAQRKLLELDQQEKNNQLTRERLQVLAKDLPNPFENHYDISFMEQTEQLIFCNTIPISNDKIEEEFNKIFSILENTGHYQTGSTMLLTDIGKTNKFHVAVPIKSPITYDGYQCGYLHAGRHLSTIHYGDYYNLSFAYNRLVCYAQENGYTLKSPFWERYYLDVANTNHPSQYITQIFIELAP